MMEIQIYIMLMEITLMEERIRRNYELDSEETLPVVHHLIKNTYQLKDEIVFEKLQIVPLSECISGEYYMDYDTFVQTSEKNYSKWVDEYLDKIVYSNKKASEDKKLRIYKLTNLITNEESYVLCSKVKGEYYFNYETFKTECYIGYAVNEVSDSIIDENKNYSYYDLLEIIDTYRENAHKNALGLH